jgi:hypothetical protein
MSYSAVIVLGNRPGLSFNDLESTMATKQANEAVTEQKHQEADKLHGTIGQHVLHVLGKPPGLHRLQIRHLWADRYRVNVLIGADPTCATVGHSYFLVADGDGNVVTSNPAITKRY